MKNKVEYQLPTKLGFIMFYNDGTIYQMSYQNIKIDYYSKACQVV